MRKKTERDEMIKRMADFIEEEVGATPFPTTSRLLQGFDTVLWEVARMEEALRNAAPGVVTAEDWKTFRKAFGRIQREAETLVSWLRFNRLEQPRN
jgi:hypothetical protein